MAMREDLEGTVDNQVYISFQHYAIQEGECAPLYIKGIPSPLFYFCMQQQCA